MGTRVTEDGKVEGTEDRGQSDEGHGQWNKENRINAEALQSLKLINIEEQRIKSKNKGMVKLVYDKTHKMASMYLLQLHPITRQYYFIFV